MAYSSSEEEEEEEEEEDGALSELSRPHRRCDVACGQEGGEGREGRGRGGSGRAGETAEDVPCRKRLKHSHQQSRNQEV